MSGDSLPSTYRRLSSEQPLLDAATELRLARRWVKRGDVAARDRLVASHLRLVLKMAQEFHWSAVDFADLVQEGNMGLLLAVRRFDPERGVRFSRYASWWIRACILRCIVENWRLVRVGSTLGQRRVMTRARKTRAAMEVGGDPVDTADLASRVGVKAKGFEELFEHVSRPELSIDALRPDGAHVVGELAADEALRPDRLLEEADERRAVAEAAGELEAGLSPRERTIFRARWRSDRSTTLETMGQKFGVSRERVRQLEARTLAKLRALLEMRLAA